MAKSMAVNSLSQGPREHGLLAEVALGSRKWPHLGLGVMDEGEEGAKRPGM